MDALEALLCPLRAHPARTRGAGCPGGDPRGRAEEASEGAQRTERNSPGAAPWVETARRKARVKEEGANTLPALGAGPAFPSPSTLFGFSLKLICHNHVCETDEHLEMSCM